MRYFVYMVECADKSLYTGITPKLVDRVKAHNDGKGAKYTRSRRPVTLVYAREFRTKSEALKEEARIKRLPRSEKLAMTR